MQMNPLAPQRSLDLAGNLSSAKPNSVGSLRVASFRLSKALGAGPAKLKPRPSPLPYRRNKLNSLSKPLLKTENSNCSWPRCAISAKPSSFNRSQDLFAESVLNHPKPRLTSRHSGQTF